MTDDLLRRNLAYLVWKEILVTQLMVSFQISQEHSASERGKKFRLHILLF